jgi:hypothetical protein
MDNPVLFSSARVDRLRRRANKACPPLFLCPPSPASPPPPPDGWSRHDADLGPLLAAFPALSLREGFVLCVYRLVIGADGSAVVWASPKGAGILEPQDCMSGHPEQPFPRPPLSITVPEALTGDGSPWSYVNASILIREIEEWGAIRHGRWWSAHTILGRDPCAAAAPTSRASARTSASGPAPAPASARTGGASPPEDWRWLSPQPGDWRPAFQFVQGSPVVSFYTFSSLGCESIYRHTDTYAPGSYAPSSHVETIAEGGPGTLL